VRCRLLSTLRTVKGIMKKIDIDNRAFREHVANCAKLKDVTDFSDFRDHNRFCDVGYALAGKPFKSHNQ